MPGSFKEGPEKKAVGRPGGSDPSAAVVRGLYFNGSYFTEVLAAVK